MAPTNGPQSSNDMQLVSDIMGALRTLEYDVAMRNQYMNRRDSYTYGSGLWTGTEIPDGFNRTMYNFLPRVIDIHTSQLMGRPFQVYSTYDKEDLSMYDDTSDPDHTKRDGIEMDNKRKLSDADARKRFIDSIVRDNGGDRLWKDGAREGSLYGTTVYKMWWDDDDKKVKIVLLESPQNHRAGWSDNDFRERDFDAYVYQMSSSQANRQYKSELGPDEEFTFSPVGSPFQQQGGAQTNDPINQFSGNPDIPTQTQRMMVTVIDFTGYLDGWKVEDDDIVPCRRGDETKISALVVGGHIVQKITTEKNMPYYYIINNRQVPRRAWGESDLSDSALEINSDYIERMSDYVTLLNKTVFPMYMGHGLSPTNIPKKKQRQIQVVSMAQDQNIDLVQTPAGGLASEFQSILNELKESFIKVTGVSRVLFDDPSVNADSNQALMTTLKGVIDIVEDKQSRWTPAILQMFNDALALMAKHVPSVRDILNPEEDWRLQVEWPSVLRKEDSTYQQIWQNIMNQGYISFETYLKKIGIEDVSEELDRIRDNYNDKVIAAVVSNTRQMLAESIITPPSTQPAGPDVKISLRGDLTPQQEGNLASTQGLNDGPFGATMGPQGNSGLAATDAQLNKGLIEGGKPGATAVQQGPDGQTADLQPDQQQSVLTPGENQGNISTTQPGSGLPTTTPQGAIDQANQQNGR